VDLDESPVSAPQRAPVVVQARAVRRADLDERVLARSITSGMRNEPPISTSSPREEDRRPARAEGVQDQEAPPPALLLTAIAGLGAGQACEQRADAIVALVALAARALDLERAVALRRTSASRRAVRVDARAPEPGVQHDAGRVDDAHEPALLLD
jgi:hypothetical protein